MKTILISSISKNDFINNCPSFQLDCILCHNISKIGGINERSLLYLLFIFSISCEIIVLVMGACVMACRKGPQLEPAHEKTEIHPIERAQIEQAVKADPPEIAKPPQQPKAELKIEQEQQNYIESSIEELKEPPRSNSRKSIKSRFFVERNSTQVPTDDEDQQGPPEVILRRPSCKSTKMIRKNLLREIKWEDESSQKNCSTKKKIQKISQDQISIDQDFTKNLIVCIRSKQPLSLPVQEAEKIDQNINESFVKKVINDDSLNEKTRFLKYKDGSRYEGNLLNGQRHGRGALIWSDGTKYDGQWNQGQPHGVGVLIYADGDQYSGQFHYSLPQGRGEFFSPEGLTYEGEWKKGEPEGQGIEIFKKGEKYTGGWTKGKKNGYGELLFQDGASYYKGAFVNNQLQGHGEYYWHGKSHYVGQWLHNQKSGMGRLDMANGQWFQGEFKRDKMHGKGVFCDKNRSLFEGVWQNGRREGLMVQTTATGQVRRGLWYFNQFLRQIEASQVPCKKNILCTPKAVSPQ